MLPCKHGRFSGLSIRSPSPDAFSREDARKRSSVVGEAKEYTGMWESVLSEGSTSQPLSVLSLYGLFTTRYRGQDNSVLPEISFTEFFEAQKLRGVPKDSESHEEERSSDEKRNQEDT